MPEINTTQNFIKSRLEGLDLPVEKIVASQPQYSQSDEEYGEIFDKTQQYVVTEKLSEIDNAIATGDTSILENIVSGYIQKNFKKYIPNMTVLMTLTKKVVDDMSGYGFLNKYLARKDEIEEININSWNTVEVRWCKGTVELTDDKFRSPQHARDVIIRLLRPTGRFLDENKIYEISYIGKSIRLTTVVFPIVDSEIGVAASIRFIHSAVFTSDKLVDSKFMTQDMCDTLSVFLNHGVSICVCGATGSGKTTLCNAMLEGVDPKTRIITLEGGTREFELIRTDEKGKTINNRLHLQTRPHKDAKLNVDLQLLLDLVLKFDPDIVVVGEMVSEEAFIASETARTGHTVMTTIHTKSSFDAYHRMMTLGIRKYDLREEMMLKLMVDAFPIIVYCKKYPDGIRRVQSILEGYYKDGKICYNELYHFDVSKNTVIDDRLKIDGVFNHKNQITDALRETLIDNGALDSEIKGI